MTFGVGAFSIINNLSADSSIVSVKLQPLFNDEARLNKFTGIGVGVLGGFLTLFVLPSNFFASINITPGIGLMYKKVETGHVQYRPSNPILFKMGLSGAVGYNGKRIYVNLIVGSGVYFTNLDFGNKSRFNLTNAKLAIGYKLGS